MMDTLSETAQQRAARDNLATAAALNAAASAEDRVAEAEVRSLEALDANAEARAGLRQQADKQQLRIAVRDLVEGVRGMVRVAPLTAVVVGLAAGMLLRGRKRRPPPRR
jgi:glutamine synthetase adenylyltransferase